jgi:hypothetical protein
MVNPILCNWSHRLNFFHESDVDVLPSHQISAMFYVFLSYCVGSELLFP